MSRVRASPTASQPAYILASHTALVNTRASMLDSSSQHWQQRAEGAGGRLSTCVARLPADEWVRSIQRPVRRGHQGGALFLMASHGCFDHRSRKLHPALPENAIGLHGCGTLLQSTRLQVAGPPCTASDASAAAADASVQVQQCLNPGVPPAVPTTFGTKADVDVSACSFHLCVAAAAAAVAAAAVHAGLPECLRLRSHLPTSRCRLDLSHGVLCILIGLVPPAPEPVSPACTAGTTCRASAPATPWMAARTAPP